MVSSPITSWQINGEKMETVTNFTFLVSKITVDADCSHGIKRHLPLGRKAMTSLNSILKSRDITLPTKVQLVKVMVFPIVIHRCESWTIKKAEHRRIDNFWTVMLEKTLESFLDNHQSILKEINTKYWLEGLMLKLKLQYSDYLMWRADSLEKIVMLGNIEEKGMTEDEMVGWHHWFNGH